MGDRLRAVCEGDTTDSGRELGPGRGLRAAALVEDVVRGRGFPAGDRVAVVESVDRAGPEPEGTRVVVEREDAAEVVRMRTALGRVAGRAVFSSSPVLASRFVVGNGRANTQSQSRSKIIW